MAKTYRGSLYDRRDREVRFEFSIRQGRGPFYSHRMGNWLPGDPPEVIFETAWVRLQSRSGNRRREIELSAAQVERMVGMGNAMEASS